MKIKKVFLIFLSFLLLTGCTAKANLIITTDKKIEENIQVYNTWQNLKNDYKNIEEAKKNYVLSYQDFFKNTKYKVSYHTKNALLKAIIKNTSHTLNTISDTAIYSSLFVPIVVDKNHYTMAIQENALDLFEDTLGVGAEDYLFLNEIEINIQFHNVIENANSDAYNSKTNTHTWIIHKENLNRNIEFTIANEKRYDIIIPYLIKKHIDFILLGIVLLIIGITSLFIIRASKRENAI